MASKGYHKLREALSDEIRDMHRAIVPLMEELKAIDWYNQRVAACKNVKLNAILAYNRDKKRSMPPWFLSGSGARIQPLTAN